MSQQRAVIFGPPGCGKTTKLLDLLEQELDRGTDPRRIAFVSFTRKAVHEALDRVVDRFTIKKSSLPYFKTLHSLAYHALGLTSDDVFTARHAREFSEVVGRPLSAGDNQSEEMPLPVGNKEGDTLLFLESLSRATGKSLEQVYHEQAPDHVSPEELKRFARAYESYKRYVHVLDYTDFLTMFVENVDPLDVDVVFLDEAQDLFPLQWRVFYHMSRRATRVVVAGDDDQAIYQWSGADVDSFLKFDGVKEILHQSHRLPHDVFQHSQSILTNIKHRQPKEWAPRNEKGQVTFLLSEDHADLHMGGSWLLLARNAYMLPRLETVAREQSVAYTVKQRSSVDKKEAAAIRAWERLRKGDAVSLDDARAVYTFLRSSVDVQRGANLKNADDTEYTMHRLREQYGLLTDGPWFDALHKMSLYQREYYRSVLRRGANLFAPPQIHINTIHGVKGGEADNVLVLSDMAWRSYQSYANDSDEEHRVFYVAATRARHNLFIVAGSSKYAYDW